HQAELLAEMDGGAEVFLEEGLVERGAGPPGVEADAELALAVVEAAGDEIADVRDEIDLVAVGGLAFGVADGPGEDPGVPAVEGAGTAGLQDGFGRHDWPVPFWALSM